MKLLNTIASAVALMVATTTCSFAATEIDEKDFGPTYGSMVADTIVGKPLGALAVVGGVVTAIASMPFTIYNDEIDQVERKLILEQFFEQFFERFFTIFLWVISGWQVGQNVLAR